MRTRGRKLIKANRHNDGQYHLFFADGSMATADPLVVSDGAWSKVRQLLSAAVQAQD